MGRRLLLFALASVLMLGFACTTPAVGASSLCLNTTCREDNGYFALPLESPLHPDRPASGVGTCTLCADAGTPSPCAGNCTRCCYKRTCADYDGMGTPYCPYGFDANAGPGNVAVTSGEDAAARFSKCCTATIPNSFPAPSATIAGGVQAIAPSQTNWGFLEDTNTSPYVSYKGRLTGMCFKVTANRSCDASANPECCNAAAKPAFLQLKLPVPAALSGAGADSSPRYQALSQLSRCGLWFGRPNGRAALRARWRFTDQDAADGQAAGTAEVDARYMTLPLNFGVAGEARMCVYVADVIEDRDCGWENLCGLKDSDPVGYVGNATLGIVTPASPKRRLGCEVRLVGAAAVRLGNTVTSRCVGLTHTVTGFSSVRQHCGGWNYPCGNSSVCSDTRDGFTCACAAGYESITDNGRNCVDVDECSAAINPCGSNSRCNNTDGNYTCACETGYSSPTNNSRNCVAVCSCYNGGTCDVVGVCNCPSGYTGNICQTTATSGSTTDTWYYSGAARRRRSLLAAAEDATAIELAYVTAYQNALPAANLQVVAVAERAQAAGLQSQTQRRLQGVAGDWVVTVTVSPDPSSGITLDVLSRIVSSPAFPHEVVQQLSQMPESPVQGGGVCQTDSSGVCSDAAPQFTVDPGTGGVSTNDNECNNRGAFKGGVCTCNQGYAGATCAYKLMSGLSYAGTDIPSGPLACDTSACCADNCTSTAGCTAFVWKGASGDCFLKQGLTTPSLEAGAVTGITYGTSMCWPNCCINGGVATSDGSCSCAGTGFTGATCNVSLCSLPETCNAALTASCSKGVCTCKQGYGGVDCSLDIDECSAANRANFCDTSDVATCTNSVGSYFCICKSGYTSTNDGKTCTDVNECSDPTTCGASSGAGNCTNSPGSYSCSCNSGWTFAIGTCVDVNECSNTTTCGVSSGAGTCTNSAGSYSCSCNSGWTFNGATCVDVDECSNSAICGGQGTCINFQGSYSCSCNSGWAFNGATCGSYVASYLYMSSTDDGSATMTLPWALQLYGTTYPAGSQVYVSTNGFLTFSSASTKTAFNNAHPSQLAGTSFGPFATVAPFWDDLLVLGGSSAVYWAPISGGPLLVQWTVVTLYGDTAVLTFQAFVYPNSNVGFVYKSMTGSPGATGSSATIFVNNANATKYYLVSHNTNNVATSGTKILLTWDAASGTYSRRTWTEAPDVLLP